MNRIDVLPDDILLEIFDFYLGVHVSPRHVGKPEVETWQSLVHVCRRWRSLVFRSQRRLNLRLWCTPQTPARDTLDVWPALPLIVWGDMAISSGTDNITAALGQSNRIHHVFLLRLAGWQLEQVLAPMHVPFPELTDLGLFSDDETLPIIPDSFLCGSAPRLQYFYLTGIPFPGMPNLLLSATHLVSLWLSNIPHSGYISPEAIAALLSVLSSLKTLSLEFQSPQSHPDWESRSLPPPNRSILPSLDEIHFKGVTEYLEELVARIDTPQLHGMEITFFNQIDFDTPRLAQFINRTPTLRTPDEAHVQFDDSTASVRLQNRTSKSGHHNLRINVLCREPDWQLSSIEQVCDSSLRPLSTVEDLYIYNHYWELFWKDEAIDDTLWLQLLLPFTAVKRLYLSGEFARGIAAALQEVVGGGITDVFPGLKNIYVKGLRVEPSSGHFQENFAQFVAARQLSNHPIAISDWDTI
jgi:hypothetical protein